MNLNAGHLLSRTTYTFRRFRIYGRNQHTQVYGRIGYYFICIASNINNTQHLETSDKGVNILF